jgi:hypothetical protein
MPSKSTSSEKKRALLKVVAPTGAVGLLASEVPTVVLEGLLKKLNAGKPELMSHDNATNNDAPRTKAKRHSKTHRQAD